MGFALWWEKGLWPQPLRAGLSIWTTPVTEALVLQGGLGGSGLSSRHPAQSPRGLYLGQPSARLHALADPKAFCGVGGGRCGSGGLTGLMAGTQAPGSAERAEVMVLWRVGSPDPGGAVENRVQYPGFESWFCLSLAVWPWAGHLPSLGLCFPV